MNTTALLANGTSREIEKLCQVCQVCQVSGGVPSQNAAKEGLSKYFEQAFCMGLYATGGKIDTATALRFNNRF